MTDNLLKTGRAIKALAEYGKEQRDRQFAAFMGVAYPFPPVSRAALLKGWIADKLEAFANWVRWL